MNVFMGYNPTVAKQVKVSVWVKEIDGAEPIFPATPKDGDCFIVFDTDDDVLADNPSSKKAYANGSWGDAGGGGDSGVSFPTFALIVNSQAATMNWQCDMTYAEVSAVYDEEALGVPFTDCPCKYQSRNVKAWRKMEYWTKEDIEDGGITFYTDLPSTVIGGFMVRTSTLVDSKPDVLYANDGNFYKVVNGS